MSSPASKNRKGNRKLMDQAAKDQRLPETDTRGATRRSKYGARLEKLRRRSG